MELEKQIKKYRAQLHLSQEALADKIYVTRQTISNWETGKNYPDIHSLLLLSSLFQISLDELIKGDLDEMKTEINAQEIKKFNKQSILFSCLLLATVISIAPLTYYLRMFGWILWGILFLITFLYSLQIEKFKKHHKIQTYKEIVAFSKGERLDEITQQRERKKYPFQFFLKMLVSAILGFLITYFLMKLLHLYF